MISLLLEADFDGKQVCGRTGHRSLKSLENYHGPSSRMKKRQTSAILASIDPNISSVAVLPGSRSQVSDQVVSECKENVFGRGVKRKACNSFDEMIFKQQQLFNQQNSIMANLYNSRGGNNVGN